MLDLNTFKAFWVPSLSQFGGGIWKCVTITMPDLNTSYVLGFISRLCDAAILVSPSVNRGCVSISDLEVCYENVIWVRI